MTDMFSGPHTSHSAPETSAAAAEKVKPKLPSIRSRVLAFAKGRGQGGFTDPEVVELGPNDIIGERSWRPRRSELTDENRILDSGRRFIGENGNEFVIWIHRDFHPSPPPIRERGKREAKWTGEAERKAVLELLRQHHRQSTSGLIRDKITEIGQQIAAGSHRI